MQRLSPQRLLDNEDALNKLPPEVLEAYLEISYHHHKLLEELAQR